MRLASFSGPGLAEAVAPEARRTIPFDYRFRFLLRDEPASGRRSSFVDRTLSATVNVSIEAIFTAVSIGYGLIPELDQKAFGLEIIGDLQDRAAGGPAPVPVAAVPVGAVPVGAVPVGAVPVGAVPGAVLPRRPIVLPPGVVAKVNKAAEDRVALAALKAGVLQSIAKEAPERDRARLADLAPDVRRALTGTPRQMTIGDLIRALARSLGEEDFTRKGEVGPDTEAELLNGIRLNPEVARFFLGTSEAVFLDPAQLGRMFETLPKQPERVQFLYGLYDEATGREFQSEPILNIAGLGIADGDRPFRRFAQPIAFAPRSTIRMDVIPKTDFRGELQIVLHGFKVLGGEGTPTGRAARRRRPRAR